MAFVCEEFPTPRLDIIERLIKVKSPYMINIINWFTEYPPNGDGKKLFVIASRPRGDTFLASRPTAPKKLRIPDLKADILLPVAKALKALHDHRIPHRAIRPGNLFYIVAEGDKIMLGEGVTTSAGYMQDRRYETIPCGMCEPEGRGSGSLSDDIYALGVLATELLYGGLPAVADMEDLIYKKLYSGSYNFFLENRETFEPMTPFLTGTLADNERERWDIDAVLSWLDGKSVRVLIGSSDARGGRPKVFNNYDNYSCDQLAFSLSRKPKEALDFLLTGDIQNWLRFSVIDPQKTEQLEDLLQGQSILKDGNDFQKYRLLCEVILLLSNKMPISWNGVNAMPSGIGAALGYALNEKKSTKNLENILYARMPVHWEEQQKAFGNNPTKLVFNFQQIPRILDRKRIGYGVEVVTYILNPALPCQSPLVKKQFVISVDHLLQALEVYAQTNKSEQVNLLDHHVMAFVMARTRIIQDTDLRGLLAKDPLKLAFNRLKILSKLQNRSSADTLPNITELFMRQTRKIFDKYFHEPTRKWLQDMSQTIIAAGDLTQLKNLVDNPGRLETDHQKFFAACKYYDGLEREIQHLSDNILHDKSHMRLNSSRVYAVAVSSAFSTMALIGYFIYYFL